MSIEINQQAPDFILPADDGSAFSLHDLRGQKLLLVFYPGDNTPVCTAQLCDYRDGLEAFSDMNIRVVGISTNNAISHQKFKTKYALPFTLLTDIAGGVAKQYGAWGLFGMKRAIFLVDENSVLRYVKVEAISVFRRHRKELIKVLQDLI